MAQIFCRRLKIEQGIVSVESRFSYDRLRFFPVSRFVSSTPFYRYYAGVDKPHFEIRNEYYNYYAGFNDLYLDIVLDICIYMTICYTNMYDSYD